MHHLALASKQVSKNLQVICGDSHVISALIN